MGRGNLRISSQNYYVTTTANNRIKVWKLESLDHTKNEIGKLLTELFEPNYLKIHYTSIAIFDDNQNSNNCLIAMGDKVGRIVLFNINKSCKMLEISQHTKDPSKTFKHVQGGHHSRINSIQFDKINNNDNDNDSSSIRIITCSNDKKLCQWDLNGKLINSMSIGDDIPTALTITYPFKPQQHKKKKKKKKHLNSNKYLMIASNNINVWNISNTDNYKSLGSFQGHASQTRYLRLTQDNQYLVSAGQDRYVYIWKCKSFYKKKLDKTDGNKLKSAEYSLPLDDDVISIDIKTITKPLNEDEIKYLKEVQQTKKEKKKKKKDKAIGSTKNVYYICAASKSTIYIYCFDPIQQHRFNANNDKNGNLKPVVEISIADDANINDDEIDSTLSWIQHIQFMNDKQLMILRGKQSMPVIKQITFIHDTDDNEKDIDMSFIKHIVLENVTASFDIDNNKKIDLSGNVYEHEKKIAVDQHLTVLHVADVSMANPKSYDQYEMNVDKKDKKTSKKRKRNDDDDDDDDDDEGDMDNNHNKKDVNNDEPPTKKQRIESDSITFQDKLYEIEKKTEEDKNKGQLRIPNADSLYTLLTQSLKANDQTMFERLLGMQNDETMREFEGDIIKNTLDRISGSMACELLSKLTDKFRVSPRQSISILRWLLPLLNSHSASFAKNLSSRKHLISIHQAIDYQIKSLLPTMKLQGRLSLLMNQMDKVNQFRENNNKSNINISNGLEMARNKALFVHNEQEIDDNDLNMK